MPSAKKQSPPRPHADGNEPRPNTRWRHLEVPLVPGMATFEWNVPEGTTWYSDNWRQIIQAEYDGPMPNLQDWWMARIHPEDVPSLYRGVLAIHAGFLDRYEVVIRFRRGDGAWIRLLIRSAVTEKSDDGAPLIACGVCLDITDSIFDDSERACARLGPKMDIRTILENSPDLFIRFDRDLAPVYVNPAIKAYLGSPEYESGREHWIRLVGDYKDIFGRNVGRVFSGSLAVREEVVLRMSNGREIVGDCTFWPEYTETGELHFVMVQFRDITEQRVVEQRNMFNEQRLEALNRLTSMEHATEKEVLRFVLDSVMSLTSSRSGFIFVSNQREENKGFLLWSEDHYELLGPSAGLAESYLPEDLQMQIRERGVRSINNGDGVRPLYVVFDGRMPVMRGILAPALENDRVVCIAGVCNKDSDYDEFDMLQFETFLNSAWLTLRQRRFIEELQNAKETAEAANKAKDAFLANVSHELRTPLNGVISMLQLIDSLPLGPQQREYLDVAAASGKTLLRIISDLLDFSCMESGKMSLAEDIFNCKSVVQSACDVFMEDMAEKDLVFCSSIDMDIPDHLLGDEGRVRQIIFNLVGNSLKFTNSGRIEVACSRYAGPAPAGKSGIVLQVKDTGIGIPADKLATIFDAFMQVESLQRRKYPGTGLGLGIVKHLTRLMEGEVRVESEAGAGTTIRCLLFFGVPSPDLLILPYARQAPDIYEQAGALEILIAEDDDVGSMAIQAFLKKRGHRVLCVEDGKEALEALQLRHFDCLFTDIAMPNMDGSELVRRIRRGETRDCPPGEGVLSKVRQVYPGTSGELRPVDPEMIVVAVSAHAMIGDRERFLSQGMDLYVSKPLIANELNEALAEVKRRLER